ncbi:hypothetical protein LJB82_03390 [Desulfovibrio sp. OttesenSCG-928-M16]|nr:hypothetical protein [Desulfovibrio sp. OttesenSCG-928-M16]
MFSDPLTAAMTMQLLCFFGMVVIFVFVMRSLSSLGAEMREAFRKQQMFLSDLERQIQDLNFAVKRLQGEEIEGQGIPAVPENDDLLSLLENAARNASSLPLDGREQSLAGDEYDPAKDPNLFEDAYTAGSSSRRLAGRDRR